MSVQDARTHGDLARRCAASAAVTLSKLLGRSLVSSTPIRAPLGEKEEPLRLLADGEGGVVVCMRLSGEPGGWAGIAASAGAVRKIVADLIGSAQGCDLLSERETSALRELGNVAISAAASAIGEARGEIVLPSVPSLVLVDETGVGIEEVCGLRDLLGCESFESEIHEPGSPFRVRFFWVLPPMRRQGPSGP
jgi:chemotaxis protein CheY-P-specific phosphatase CheC